jgi:hypothetical protein
MITSEIKTITPTMAAKWLKENNTHNRPLYERTIQKYALDMKAGAWTVTNQGIGFAEDGTLLDGQQRLSAIVRADVPIKTLILSGLPRTYKTNGDGELFTQDVIDGNKVRSIGDILSLSYELTDPNRKVSIANMIVAAISKGGFPKISPRVIYKIIDLYADEIEFIASNRSNIPGLYYTPAITGIVLAAKVDLDKAIDFKDKYYRGTNLRSGDPVLTFRQFMLSRSRFDKSGARAGSMRLTTLKYSLTALKRHFDGKPLKRLVATETDRDYFLSKQKTCVQMVTEWITI